MLPAVLAALTIPAASVAVPGPIQPSDGDDPMPTYAVRKYEPISNRTEETYGWMLLSDHSVAFSRLDSRMELQLWGIEPDKPTDELSGAQIYHVVNAKEFFEANEGTAFCSNPANWFIVSKVKNQYPYAVPGEVRIFLFYVDDILQFSWNKPHVCTEMTYLIDTAKEYPSLTGAIPRR